MLYQKPAQALISSRIINYREKLMKAQDNEKCNILQLYAVAG